MDSNNIEASNNLFILIDFETTGLKLPNNRIVQWGSMLLKTKGKDDCTFDETINPKIPVSKYSKASQIHQISIDKLRNSPSFPEVFTNFTKWLSIHSNNVTNIVLCAHNGFDFDFEFLITEMIRYNLSFSQEKITLIDSLPIFKIWYPNQENYKLGSLYQNIKKRQLDGAHNALVDVNAMRKIMCDYSKNKKNMNAEYDIETDLLTISEVKDFNTEYSKFHNKILTENQNLSPIYYYINSNFKDNDIVKKDGGKWCDLKRKFYYPSQEIYKKARIK